MRGWLYDVIINAFLEILVRVSNSKRSAYVATYWPQVVFSTLYRNEPWNCAEASHINNVLETENLNFIFLPYNTGGHWTLLVVFINEKQIWMLNPFVNTTSAALDTYANYIQNSLLLLKNENFEIISPRRTSQVDFISCGVLVL